MTTTTTTFVPSLQLNAGFYADAVAPLVHPYEHAAALLGWGSDVLGYDSARSTDHGWGPRLQLFVSPQDVAGVRERVDGGLPETYDGWPVRFGWDEVEAEHRVDVVSLGDWLKGQLGLDPRSGVEPIDWLSVPQQQILGVVRGAVYADPNGELAAVRDSLRWYPHDVWLWLLASQWCRIGQEIAFAGRTAEAGDELGSRLVAGRLVRELMRLIFLQSKAYWPYTKWFGTAFAELAGTDEITPALERAVTATDYPAREEALVEAYAIVARRHDESGVTDAVEWKIGQYFSRPYRVLSGGFAEACQAQVADRTLRKLPLVGSVDQFVDSTDVLGAADRAQYLRSLYEKLS